MPSRDQSTSVLSELSADQERRWREQGEPLPVEAYLTQRPELNDRPDLLLALLLNELILRTERGETPQPDEYVKRFPALAADLPELFGRLATLRHAAAATPEPTATETAPERPSHRRGKAGPLRLPEVPGYEVLEFIAAGGQGDVFRARHILLRRVVALKVLNQRAEDDEVLARFSREGRLTALLDHPNVLRVYDCAHYEGRLYISMEFADGGSLSERLEGGHLPPHDAAVLLRTLSRAVHHLFATHQIVHRDLKPSNVLFLDDGTPKVADFGLAKRVSADATRLTGGSEVLGTASYMAPEQAAGRTRDVTAATDVYALGAILYECLSGEPPFHGETWLETIDMVRHQPVRPPSQHRADVPPALERICLRCLEKTPSDRYASAADLADDLDHFLTGAPLASVPAELRAATRPKASDPALPAVAPLRTAEPGLARPRLPGYEILDEMGQGGTGTVYKARQLSMNRTVALKVLHNSLDKAARWKRLQEEAAHLAALHHPNIASIHELTCADGWFYVSTEFVQEGSLCRHLGNPSLPVGAIAELVQQIALAAGFCHVRGVVHRNLKPSNVLLAPPQPGQDDDRHDSAMRVFGVPRITDFENARIVSGVERKKAALGRLIPSEERESFTTQPGQVVGTPEYMSPEQATGDVARHGPASDVWSLGIILYELLTGRPAIADGSRAEILQRVRAAEFVPPSRRRSAVPWDLERICLRCLERRSEQRFADGNELAQALGEWLARWRRWPSNWWRRLMFWRQP